MAQESENFDTQKLRTLIEFNRESIRKLQEEVGRYANLFELRSLKEKEADAHGIIQTLQDEIERYSKLLELRKLKADPQIIIQTDLPNPPVLPPPEPPQEIPPVS